ncbi:hypothetical protein SNOG_09802 [Parastagonospora nodorum SN15]|uniref:Secreted protein n=1 Tax=Phaeosphaeria nodorum (strain SN15 / ATCC MYA-4574 / FGSC 10173) TaxID=321614 RepID=Q0UEL2_PHANO|nr:hypothetical protein SNOG_09802 [Parastagonospora nodorum SN15]EAT83067.1 hypothetical protein SNOG_09802 [Parastagonospora nodorum SN15]
MVRCYSILQLVLWLVFFLPKECMKTPSSKVFRTQQASNIDRDFPIASLAKKLSDQHVRNSNMIIYADDTRCGKPRRYVCQT